MSVFPSFYNIYIYTQYTLSRIKETRYIRRSYKLLAFSNLLLATRVKVNSPPHTKDEGGELTKKQVALNIKNLENSEHVFSWKCKLMTKRVKHLLKSAKIKDKFLKKRMQQVACNGWLVAVSRDALIEKNNGWICDCGEWTFGDDNLHVPIARRKEIVKRGRVKKCRR